jgi:hypothetical protein
MGHRTREEASLFFRRLVRPYERASSSFYLETPG